MKRQNTGLTVVELLVVITVIAILAAMLFPALARSRHAARAITCRHNLRQPGLATDLYRTDHLHDPAVLSAAWPSGPPAALNAALAMARPSLPASSKRGWNAPSGTAKKISIFLWHRPGRYGTNHASRDRLRA